MRTTIIATQCLYPATQLGRNGTLFQSIQYVLLSAILIRIAIVEVKMA
jgi:hypothetical protein